MANSHKSYASPKKSARQTSKMYRNPKYAAQKKLLKPSGPMFKNH